MNKWEKKNLLLKLIRLIQLLSISTQYWPIKYLIELEPLANKLERGQIQITVYKKANSFKIIK